MTPVTKHKPTGIYAALHQQPPAVLKTNLTKDSISGINGHASALQSNMLQAQGQVNANITNIGDSVFRSSYAKWSSIVTGVITFGTLVVHTAVNWNNNSLTTNLVQVGTIVGIAATAIHTVTIYLYRKKQSHQLKVATAKKELLETTMTSLSFLKESTKMAKRCVASGAANNISSIFPVFQSYITSLPAGTVPNSLADAWTKVGTIVSQPASPERQDQLSAYIEGMILPIIHHYLDQVALKLNELGYQLVDNKVEKDEASSSHRLPPSNSADRDKEKDLDEDIQVVIDS